MGIGDAKGTIRWVSSNDPGPIRRFKFDRFQQLLLMKVLDSGSYIFEVFACATGVFQMQTSLAPLRNVQKIAVWDSISSNILQIVLDSVNGNHIAVSRHDSLTNVDNPPINVEFSEVVRSIGFTPDSIVLLVNGCWVCLMQINDKRCAENMQYLFLLPPEVTELMEDIWYTEGLLTIKKSSALWKFKFDLNSQ